MDRTGTRRPRDTSSKGHIVQGKTFADTSVEDGYSIVPIYTDKKENQIFLIFKEIQRGALAKSYMRKGILIYEEMRKYFPVSHI